MNSLPGRAKLSRLRPPVLKEPAVRGMAAGSPYGLLVIWQRIQSTPACAKMALGGASRKTDPKKETGREQLTLAQVRPRRIFLGALPVGRQSCLT